MTARQTPPPRPGVKLLELLEERHMSQAELCARMGRSRKLINEIIKGKASIATDTAYQLELVLGQEASYWNRLEADYHDHRVRERHREELSAKLEWLDELPVAAMIEAKWIEKQPSPLEQAQYLLSWFGVASPARWRDLYIAPKGLRRSPRDLESDPGALAAWLRAGEIQCMDMNTPTYDRKKFQIHLRKIRGLTREAPHVFQDRMIELANECGVAVTYARELPGIRVAGASRWLSPRKALIQLSLLHQTDADLWFTFFHEAAHILLHGRKQLFVEGMVEGKPSRDDVLEEVEADHFASNLLLPTSDLEELRPLCRQNALTHKAVRDFAAAHAITAGIVVMRLQHLGWIPPTAFDRMKRAMEWAPPGTYVDV